MQWDTVQAGPGGVVVNFTGGWKGLPRDSPCWARYRAAATSQSADHVVIGVWITTHAEYGPCEAIGFRHALRVPLDAPLGDREVRRAPMGALSPFDDG